MSDHEKSNSAPAGFKSLGANYQPPSLEEIQALLPRDEVLEFIGHGGMGTYYRAVQSRLDREVAVKVLLVDAQEDASLIDGFKSEAKAMARLNHFNIIKIFDFGVADSKLYLIVEYVKGKTLEQLVARRGFGIREVVSLLGQVCDALEHAHGMGVIHRDLRLGNTMVDEEGVVKVGDFGLARLIGEELFRHNLVGENQDMGTLDYVAPEQHGEGGDIDLRADIFSLGAMLYKLSTRTLPYDEYVPPSHFVPDINPLVDQIVLRCMQRRPENRFQSIAEFRDMLLQLHPR
ncbi:MAG: serine/threonine-protein kinase [Akkermansiaceae bacterium]|nr:serine/threonine-protein kinase [Akkermansiaceae bacterium]